MADRPETRAEGVLCPHCSARPGVACRGPGVVGGLHARRRDLARRNAIEAGQFGRAGQVECPACHAAPGEDCVSPSKRPRRAGLQPLFHDERFEGARTTTRQLTRPAGQGGYRLVDA
jgi:hypothetical protein